MQANRQNGDGKGVDIYGRDALSLDNFNSLNIKMYRIRIDVCFTNPIFEEKKNLYIIYINMLYIVSVTRKHKWSPQKKTKLISKFDGIKSVVIVNLDRNSNIPFDYKIDR